MAKMFVMTGIPGSGKTTFAKLFAETNGIKYIGIDDFYAKVNGDEKIRDNKFRVWIECFEEIHAAEEAGIDIIVDTNAPNAYERSDFLRWFSNYEHHLIWMVADTEFCKENNRKRDRKIPDDCMEQLIQEYLQPSFAEFQIGWDSINCIENNNEEGFTFTFPEFYYNGPSYNPRIPRELWFVPVREIKEVKVKNGKCVP